MNEKIDLTKILKDCPKGFELYSPLCGTVLLCGIGNSLIGDDYYPVKCECHDGQLIRFTKEGYFCYYHDAECLLLPSKDQRDWSKFTAPWYKKEKFDPKTLQPFDRVLARDSCSNVWICSIFSYIQQKSTIPYVCVGSNWKYCIPYNDDTKHLVGTTGKAPEYYRYWED